MRTVLQIKKDIFTKSTTNFDELALEVFQYQAICNPIYKQFLTYLGIEAATIKQVVDIPFLPIELFKTHQITSQSIGESVNIEQVFTSSGTTGSTVSQHFVSDLNLYEQSFLNGFHAFYGSPKQYCFLALLPSYLERKGSSLVYMTKALIEQSEHPKSGFYLNNYGALMEQLKALEEAKQPTILLGVTYALLDVAEQFQLDLKHTIVMETGGMKGRRKELIRSELYDVLKKNFELESIHSEYGMTELLSQAYGINEEFYTPNWMKILIRETTDPRQLLDNGKTGAINVIDLANLHSCSFIATADLGKKMENGAFQVLGRMDNSDVRGCNLMVL